VSSKRNEEQVSVVESSDVTHESIEEQIMSNSVSESDLLFNKTRENIQTAETPADEVVETQLIAEAEEESMPSNQHQEKMTNEDVVESNGNEEKSTNEAEINDMPKKVSNESIAQEVCVTESSDITENISSSSKTTSHEQKEKKLSHVNITRKSASDEHEDPLITKLDKRIDKELRIIQGNNVDEEDSDDIDDDTLNELLYGQRAKELNDFLKV